MADDKPVISDEEVDELWDAVGHGALTDVDRFYVRAALSAFLAARVPDVRLPRLPPYDNPMRLDTHEDGFNACREQILRGKP